MSPERSLPPRESGSAAALVGRFPPVRPPVSTAGAAVTIVLRDGSSDVEALLIERTVKPTDPASGQVALPGGRVDDRDGSLTATAVRELREEVGLSVEDLEGLPRFVTCATASRFGLTVGVFAVQLAAAARGPTAESPEEVAHVFWLPRSALTEGRAVERTDVGRVRTVLATVHEGHVVWGFTRRVLRDFFGLPVEDPATGPILPPRPPSSEGAAVP